MESKIALYEADGTQIGETFIRRARQLVKQQRAVWMDDSHTAIQFVADVSDVEEVKEESAASYPDGDKKLYALAEMRLRDRRRMIMHLLLIIPQFFLVIIVANIISNGWHGEPAFLFVGFAFGVMATFNIMNIRAYYRQHVEGQAFDAGLFAYMKNRREIQLAAEVERLRRMGYGE